MEILDASGPPLSSSSSSSSLSPAHSLGSRSGSGSGSGSGWVYDASVDMDLDFEGVNNDGGGGGGGGEGELVWQASQSTCEALNQLLTDANSVKDSASDFTTQEKTWSPLADSTSPFLSPMHSASETHLSRLSRSRPSRVSRPPSVLQDDARRPKARAREVRPGAESGDGDGVATTARLENSAPELLAKIRSVAKQVDASTARRVQAVERARVRAQIQIQGVKKPGPGRRTGSIPDARTKAKVANGAAGGVLRSQSFPGVVSEIAAKRPAMATSKGGEIERMDMDVDEDTQRMPPPPNIPPRRTWSGTGLVGEKDPGKTVKHVHDQDLLMATNAEPFPISAPSPSSLFYAPPTSESAKDARGQTSTTLKSTQKETNPDVQGHRVSNGQIAKTTNKSSPPPCALRVNEALQNIAQEHLTPPIRQPSPPQLPAPKIPETRPTISKEPVTVKTDPSRPSMYVPPPRSQGPPALGMRRAASTQSPSNASRSTSSTGLLTRQKKFSPPLAKNRSPGPAAAPVPVPVAVQTAGVAYGSGSRGIVPGFNSPAAARTSKPEERAAIVARVRAQQQQAVKVKEGKEEEESRAFQSAKTSGVVSGGKRVKESTSPSAPVGADDSFTSMDFDMGIDDEELERACSMYD